MARNEIVARRGGQTGALGTALGHLARMTTVRTGAFGRATRSSRLVDVELLTHHRNHERHIFYRCIMRTFLLLTIGRVRCRYFQTTRSI